MDAQQLRKCLEYATRGTIVEMSARCDSNWPVWKPKWTKEMMIDRLLAEANGSFTISQATTCVDVVAGAGI